MIYHFLKPYPNEWWYSILSRFKRQSGCIYEKIFHNYFFGNVDLRCASAFPSGSFRIIDLLPKGLVDKRELMNKHTVIPFYTRLYTKTERSQFNSNFLTSTVQKMPYISSLDHSPVLGVNIVRYVVFRIRERMENRIGIENIRYHYLRFACDIDADCMLQKGV